MIDLVERQCGGAREQSTDRIPTSGSDRECSHSSHSQRQGLGQLWPDSRQDPSTCQHKDKQEKVEKGPECPNRRWGEMRAGTNRGYSDYASLSKSRRWQHHSHWMLSICLPLSLLILLSSIPSSLAQKVATAQLAAMSALNSSFPVNNRTWVATAPCSTWQNVSCDSRGNVVRISLALDSLASPGALPASISSLSALSYLRVTGGLTGSTLSTLSSLKNLQFLDLSYNSLTAALSSFPFKSLVSLTTLSLNFNSLGGSMPTTISSCNKLVHLLMGHNNLTGTIADVFGPLNKLEALDLGGNFLFGLIPASLVTPPNLWYLDVSNNQLSGSPPSNFVASNIGAVNGTYRISNNFFTTSPVPLCNKGKNWFCPMSQQGGYALTYLADFGCSFLSSEANNCFSTWTDPWISLSPSNAMFQVKKLSSAVAARGLQDTAEEGRSLKTKRTPPGQLKKWGELMSGGKLAGLLTGPWGQGRKKGFKGGYGNAGNSTCFTETQRPPAQCAAFCNAYDAKPCAGLGSCFLRSTDGSFTPACLCTSPAFQTFVNTSTNGNFDAATKLAVPNYPSCARTGKVYIPPGPPTSKPTGKYKTGLILDGVASASVPNKLNKWFTHLSVGLSGSYSSPSWNLTSSLDWRSNLGTQKQSAVSSVKDQGSCGSCWAFSAVGAVESVLAIVGRRVPADISEQQVLDCSGAGSCLGGYPADALNYFAYASPGVRNETSYPYKASKGTCNAPTVKPRMLMSGRSRKLMRSQLDSDSSRGRNLRLLQSVSGGLGATPPPPYITQMYEQSGTRGWLGILLAVQIQPAVADLEADQPSFLSYPGGFVYNNPNCFINLIMTHSVLVVGYDLTAPVPFWILKNSWGTNWGEAGYMRLAISGGVGVCGINYTPVRYPVVKGSDPCGPINPCGGGTCSVTPSGSNTCSNCPSNFMPVSNLDGSQSCGPILVCNLFDSNPCGVGTCVDDGAGAYNCICPPPSYTYGLSAAGTPTCVPGNATSTLTVSTGMTCDMIRTTYGLNRTEFNSQNPGLNCNSLSNGTLVNVSNPSYTGCALYYSITANDTCSSIESVFSITLSSLNPDLNCSSLSLGQQVCVQSGTPVMYLCTQFYAVAPGDSCSSIALTAASPPMSAHLFYGYNPGIACTNLQPSLASSSLSSIYSTIFGSQVCIAATSDSVTSVETGATRCLYGVYTVIVGDSCAGVMSKVYCSKATLFTKYNGFACSASALYRGRPLCRPLRSSSGVCS